jgi:TolA-binding protein
MLRKLLLAAPLLPLLMAAPAMAQMDSREGIALQNQILQLRQELDQVRRSGGGGSSLGAAPMAPSGRGGAPSELTGQLLDRVNQQDEELRRVRGRVDELEFRNRTLQQQLEKLQGDMDYRMQQLEGGGGSRPAPAAPAAPAQSGSLGNAPPAAAAAAAAAAGGAATAPRTAERALADGQAALGRRDYQAAEAAAREVVASRNTARSQDAQLLLGGALLGKRDFPNAALAFDDAYKRNRQSARAPEAMIGLANSFIGLNAKREACETLDNLRTEFPRLSGGIADRATDARRRGGCR